MGASEEAKGTEEVFGRESWHNGKICPENLLSLHDDFLMVNGRLSLGNASLGISANQ